MKKINEMFSQNIIKIVTIFLLMQPILDFVTGMNIKYYTNFVSSGIIFRATFLAIVIYYVIFLSKFKNKKYSISYLIMIFIYIVTFVAISLNIKGLSLVLTEIKWIIKVFYFPILLICFINIFNDNKEEVNITTYIYILATYIFLIIACQLFGIDANAYTQGKIGYIGIFNSANEISAIISILLPFLFFYNFKKGQAYIKILILIATLYCILISGTKTSFLSLVIVSLIYLIWYINKLIKEKKYKQIKTISIFAIIIVALVFITLPFTSFGKNIEKHITFLEIDNITEIFEGDNFNRLIFSDRLTFLKETKEIYNEGKDVQKIIGIGFAFEPEQKLIEIDYYDIYYRYGPIGFVIYFAPLIIIILDITKLFKYKLLNKITYSLAVFLGLILAFFTGHIFTAPSVSIYVALFMSVLYNKVALNGTKINI